MTHNDRRDPREIVFVLLHTWEDKDWLEHVKFIGVYHSRPRAQATAKALRGQPGFAKYPKGFSIVETPLDKDHWMEGFADVTQD